jgi:hypothetical protein
MSYESRESYNKAQHYKRVKCCGVCKYINDAFFTRCDLLKDENIEYTTYFYFVCDNFKRRTK